MKIACIGWGSLIWSPRALLVQRKWHNDGPLLPIEFTRQSQDGRLTLVINEKAQYVRTLWALMSTGDLEQATQSLRVREGIPLAEAGMDIGLVKVSDDDGSLDQWQGIVKEWCQKVKIDAAIWTNLSSKFNGEEGRAPSLEEAILYLNSIDFNIRKHAEEYIRKAPLQIDTEYRRAFEKEFGWSPL
ncbi:MAG: hypothetical protein AAF363_07030 [Bacteroidota bacterium]